MDTSGPSRIFAHHLQIIDDEGRPRIVLETLLGHPRLAILDANGGVQAGLSMGVDGWLCVALQSEPAHTATIGLRADPDGAGVRVQGPLGGKGRLTLGTDENSTLVVVDKAGVRRLHLLVEAGGLVYLEPANPISEGT